MHTSIKIKKLRDTAIIPEYATDGSAGFDLCVSEQTLCRAGEVTLLPTALAFDIPRGFHMDIRPRSGISTFAPRYIANSPGTIDSDYRGEVQVMFFNASQETHIFEAGDKVAQGIIIPNYQAAFRVVDELGDTMRGPGGFGSTGKSVFTGRPAI